LILTDYLEFRRYVDGELRETAHIAEPDANGKLRTDPEGQKEAERLLRAFVNAEAPVVGTPRDLAARMAALSRQIRDLITNTFESESERGQLHIQLDAFRETLIPGLSPTDFADMYAQTIAYGLFAARLSTDSPQQFSRKTAVFDLPRTNPFLRSLFGEIAGPDLDERVAWVVDELAELLRRSRMDAILEDFGGRTRREDPVVHFYETFLASYDPKMREARGVYYTPEPVVGYIVRSVDAVLKTRFGRASGLADPDTRILDPATGTATFLYYVIRHVYESLQAQGQLGTWSAYVRDDLLPRVFGFELLMAPYAVAHMKLSVLLGELGYDFSGGERLGVYLTNTLEEGGYSQPTGFAEYIAREANAATRVKNEQPIEVILGNPPYSGHSTNVNDWITGLIDDYKKVDGEPLGERNPKYLNDDYVKFIRFGQWRVDQTGRGVLAFVTNHGYLDNPTFRGMRRSLMQSFTDIYLLDLHGDAMRREKTPEGGKDENVFDIRQGVSIGIFVKEPDKQGPARVHHADLWGGRKDKYERLSEQSVENTEWEEIQPTYPNYLFDPQNAELLEEYERGWKVTEMMGTHSNGVKTHRDHFATDFDKDVIYNRISQFRDLSIPDTDIAGRHKLKDTRDWKLTERRRALANDHDWSERLTQCLYRPFDFRAYLHHSDIVELPRNEVMNHIVSRENLALLTNRQVRLDSVQHFLTADLPADFHVLETAHAAVSVFPLYLYPTNENLFDAAETERRPNLSPEFVRDLSERLGLRFVADGRGDLAETFGPEDVFHYAYAVFHSPVYRERYAEFLKRDFPRLPLTSDRDLFAALAGKGGELVGLHLMRSPALDNFITRFPEGGDNVVEKVRHDAAEGRVYINSGQYFDGVPDETWEFRVGGYQVLDKWLKDRKGRALTAADIRHYQRIVVALTDTQRLMREIDETIPGWPLE
jgi:predicted helicase